MTGKPRFIPAGSVFHFIFGNALLAFVFGACEGLWELLVNDLVWKTGAPLVYVRRLGIQVAILSGSFWAVACLGAAIVLWFYLKITDRVITRRDTWGLQSIVMFFLCTIAIGQTLTKMCSPFSNVKELRISIRFWGPAIVAASFVSAGMLIWVQRAFERRAIDIAPIRKSLILIVSIIFALWGSLCCQRASFHIDVSRPVPSSGSPNILMLVIDSLRTDHVSIYNPSQPNTPVLQKFFAQGATAFRDVQAGGSWTRPAVATMITGRNFKMGDEVQEHAVGMLPQDAPTLLTRFHAAGYETAWFTANPWASTQSGIVRQADYLFMPQKSNLAFPIAICSLNIGEENAPRIVQKVSRMMFKAMQIADGLWYRKDWIWDVDLSNKFMAWHAKPRSRPYFAYIHFMAPHYPYGDVTGPGLMPDKTIGTLSPDKDAPHPDSPLIGRYKKGYADDVRYTDQCLKPILGMLETSGELDKTIVMVTADHGEEFGEHGAVGHGNAFHQGILHVPLLMRVPNILGPRWITPTIHQIDFVPTLLSLTGLPPDPSLTGFDFSVLFRDSRTHVPDRWLPTYSYNAFTRVGAVRAGPFEFYRWALLGRTYQALYDLETDPEERTNLLRAHGELASQLQAYLHKEVMDAWGTNGERK